MAISSNATGPWNTGSTWVGGAVPGIGDAVTILAAHTVTLDGACVAQSVTVAGVLTCSTSVNSSLTTQTFITETASATTPYVFDVSSSPTVTCTIAVNASSSTTAANQRMTLAGDTGCTFKGWHRTRKTSLVTPLVAGVSTSCTVLDATGWQQGDEIVFGTTDDYANPPHHDTVVLTNVTGNDIAWTGAVTYGHVAEGSVGNP